MEKLLEETLLCDSSSQNETFQYGQKWINMENNMKKLLNKTNQTNYKTSPAKSIRNFRQIHQQSQNIEKTSPESQKQMPNQLKESVNKKSSYYQTKILKINKQQDTKNENNDANLQNLQQQSIRNLQKFNKEKIQQENQFIFIEPLRKKSSTTNIGNKNIVKEKQNIEVITNFNVINDQDRFKIQPSNLRRSSFQSFGKAFQTQKNKLDQINDNDKNTKYDNLKSANHKQEHHQNMPQQKQLITIEQNHFQPYNNDRNLIIIKKKVKENAAHDIHSKHHEGLKLIDLLTRNRAKTRSDLAEAQMQNNYFVNENNNELRKIKNSFKRAQTISEQKKQIDQLKNIKNIIKLCVKENSRSKQSLKRRQIIGKKNEFPIYREIILPSIGKQQNKSQQKMISLVKTRNIRAFTISPCRNYSQQKNRFKSLTRQNKLQSELYRKRVQSINLIIKNHKKSNQIRQNALFENIKLQTADEGPIRKLKLSDYISGNCKIHFQGNSSKKRQDIKRSSRGQQKNIKMNDIQKDMIEEIDQSKQMIITSQNKENKQSLICQRYQNFKGMHQSFPQKRRTSSNTKQNSKSKNNIQGVKHHSFVKIEFNKQQPKLLIVTK